MAQMHSDTERTDSAPSSLPPEWEAEPTVLDRLRRYWWVICLTALVGTGVGLAYGLQRNPVYTAEAELSVGRVDVATQAIPGFVAASRTLADTYSRAITARQVVGRIARKTGLSPQEVIDRVTAAPIPETATMHVLADEESSTAAIALANVASRTLVDYIRETNRFNPQTQDLLNRYRRAAAEFSRAKAALDSARQNGTVDDQTSAQAGVLEAKLQMKAAASLYGSSQAGQASPNTLILLAPAGLSESDQDSTTQRAGLAGAVGGIILGALLALVLPVSGRRGRFS
jgi:capsular polysaccharide biosynthesis protein